MMVSNKPGVVQVNIARSEVDAQKHHYSEINIKQSLVIITLNINVSDKVNYTGILLISIHKTQYNSESQI